ncbi:hypothetical protein J26TS2_30700 [Shouchella clausii]|nr:hypothetical protein J26TS2_30700 [Shouchella clausii]
MKRVLSLLLLSVFVLSGCGSVSGSSELSAFVDDFNQSARKYDATELIDSEFGEIETEDGESWKNLFESNEYSIDALYDGSDVIGYYINVESDTTSIDKNGKGYNAVLTLADTLGLKTSDLEKGMQEAFNENFYDYEDGDYNVRISVINVVSASMSITIEEK